MSQTETDSSEMWRLIGAALLLAVLCAAVALMALRADAQPPSGQRPAATAVPAAPPAPTTSAAPTTPAVPAPPADQIPDDPTVAPDPSQKADNNVSFPVDI